MTDGFWNQHRSQPQPQPQLPPHPQLQLQPQPQSHQQSLVLPSQGLPKRPRLDFGMRFYPGPFQYSGGWNLEIMDFLCCCKGCSSFFFLMERFDCGNFWIMLRVTLRDGKWRNLGGIGFSGRGRQWSGLACRICCKNSLAELADETERRMACGFVWSLSCLLFVTCRDSVKFRSNSCFESFFPCISMRPTMCDNFILFSVYASRKIVFFRSI